MFLIITLYEKEIEVFGIQCIFFMNKDRDGKFSLQLAVWRTVVEAVISLRRERLQEWETFITFLCCLFGFSAALPMATGVRTGERGIQNMCSTVERNGSCENISYAFTVCI